MFPFATRIGNEDFLKTLKMRGFSFFAVRPRDKYAHMGLIRRLLQRLIHLPRPEIMA